MKSFVLWFASFAIVALMIAVAVPKATHVFAASGDVTGPAWSANIGWINLGNTSATYGVKMATTGVSRALSGYAWSSNIGWVTFNNTDCPPSYANCQPRVEWGVSGGPAVLVKGFVRACSVFTSGCSGTLKPDVGVRGGWDGFISLGDSKATDGVNYGVKLDTTTGNATGFGWGSEVVGWVDFSGVKFELPVVPTETCDDNILNQDETAVDTGGVCAGGGGDDNPNCPVGSTCYCTAHPKDVQNCPTNCPANPDPVTNKACFCALPANAGASQCQSVGGICSNIPDAVEQSLIAQGLLTNPVTPPYRMSTDGSGKCLCVAGYILNPVTFQCTKPVYTEH